MEADQLTGGSENYAHYHPEDRIPTHDTLSRLQGVASRVTKGASYLASYNDDWIFVNATCTITLPMPRGGKEYWVVCLTGATTVTIAATTGSTINGASSVSIAAQWGSKHIKQYSDTAYVAL